MTQQFQTEDGQVHEVPEGATPEAIKRWVDKNNAVPVQHATDDMSWGEKWGRIAETGERQTAASIAAIPHGLNNLAASVQGADDPINSRNYEGEKYSVDPNAKPLPPWVTHAPKTLTPEYQQWLADKEAAAREGTIYKAIDKHTLSTQEARKGLSDLFGGAPETLANTPIQRIVQKAVPALTVGALTGGVGGAATGGVATAAAEGGAAGLTSAVTGQTAREFGAPEPLALGLELLGGGVPSAVRGGVGLVQKGAKLVDPGAEALFAKMNAGLKPENIDTALSHVAESKAAGMPVTYDEAIQDVTHGAAPQVSNLRRVVESDPAGGGQKISHMMGERGGQNAKKITKLIDDIETAPLPDGTPVPKMTQADREDLPGLTAKEAGTAVRNAQKSRTDSTEGLYAKVDAAHPGRLPGNMLDEEAAQKFGDYSGGINEIKGRDSMKEAWELAKKESRERGYAPDQSFKLDKDGNLVLERLPTGQEADAMHKAFRDLEDANRKTDGTLTSYGQAVSKTHERFLELVEDAIPEYKAARVASGEAAEAIKPVTEGSMRSLRDVQGSPREKQVAQHEELFPKEPVASGPDLAAERLRLLRGDPATSRYQAGGGKRVLNPTGQRQLATHLKSEFDKATTGTATVPESQQSGSSWWAKVMGNPAQRKELLANTKAMAGDEAHSRLEEMGKWLKMQARRPAVGSPTNTNREISEALKQSGAGAVVEAGTAAASGGASIIQRGIKALERRLEERAMRLNSKELAEMLTDPSTASKWRQLQKLPPDSAQRTRLMLSLFPKIAPTAADAATPDNPYSTR